MLRGSKDFNSIDDYKLFLNKLFTQLNAGRSPRFNEELPVIKPLPRSKMDTCSTIELKIGPSSTINIKHNTYSVDSRLIGERGKVRVMPGTSRYGMPRKKRMHSRGCVVTANTK